MLLVISDKPINDSCSNTATVTLKHEYNKSHVPVDSAALFKTVTHYCLAAVIGGMAVLPWIREVPSSTAAKLYYLYLVNNPWQLMAVSSNHEFSVVEICRQLQSSNDV